MYNINANNSHLYFYLFPLAKKHTAVHTMNSMKRTAFPSTTRFRLLLHQAGFRATPGRLAVLDLLAKTQKPLSIKNIRSRLKRGDLDQATLYRMVSALEKARVLGAVDFRHGHAHYELAAREHHHHLICERCGKVVDVSACDTSKIQVQALKISGFAKITNHSLEFFGLCKSCARLVHSA